MQDGTVELREPIERAMGYVERWAAALAELDAAAAVAGGDDRYIAEDLTHNAGRALDALLKGREATGRSVDGTVLAALRRVLFATLDNPAGFPAAWCRLADFYYDGQRPGMTCSPHNVREAVQALVELYRADGDQEARRLLGTLLDSLLAITDDGGLFRADRIAAEPLLSGAVPFVDHQVIGEFYQSCTQNRGRLIMALTQAYRALGDPRALELAQRFVRLVRAEAFAEDGRLTHLAGNHTHSITGTVHGLADWGLLTGDLDTLDHARRIMQVGLPPTCSSFGWSIEGAWREAIPGRGEVNNTGDMVQAALILGRAGWPGFFESAERMIRSHVLPSQWRVDGQQRAGGQPYRQPADDPKKPPPRVPDGEDGGWGCPAVNDRYGGSRFGVLDITQGGIQCLWAAIRDGIAQDDLGTAVNLLFSSRAPSLQVDSGLPGQGRLRIATRGTGPAPAALRVRRPSWLDGGRLAVRRDGVAERPSLTDHWMTVPIAGAASVEITFPVARRGGTEWVHHRPYHVVWDGDQVVAMDPKGECAPMYPSVAELSGRTAPGTGPGGG